MIGQRQTNIFRPSLSGKKVSECAILLAKSLDRILDCQGVTSTAASWGILLGKTLYVDISVQTCVWSRFQCFFPLFDVWFWMISSCCEGTSVDVVVVPSSSAASKCSCYWRSPSILNWFWLYLESFILLILFQIICLSEQVLLNISYPFVFFSFLGMIFKLWKVQCKHQ